MDTLQLSIIIFIEFFMMVSILIWRDSITTKGYSLLQEPARL